MKSWENYTFSQSLSPVSAFIYSYLLFFLLYCVALILFFLDFKRPPHTLLIKSSLDYHILTNESNTVKDFHSFLTCAAL